MAPVEVEVTIISAKDLKNVNWRHGDLRSYAVVWVDQSAKSSTRVHDRNDTDPAWNEKLTIPLHDCRVEDYTLSIDMSPLLNIDEVAARNAFGNSSSSARRADPTASSRSGSASPAIMCLPTGRGRDLPYAYAAAAPPPAGYPYNPSPYGQPAGYGQQPAYGYEQQPGYGQPAYVASAPVEEKKSKFGLGTGLAVGGLLGGLAIAEGLDYVEDKIAEDAAEKVEDDLAYDNYGGGGDDNYGGDDDY